MENSNCRLCGNAPTIESHIFPKFAYKYYISDQTKGGQFVDLVGDKSVHNTQIKKHLFCHDCDSNMLGDDYAAKLYQQINRNPDSAQGYTSDLVLFAASISLRVTLWQRELGRTLSPQHSDNLKDSIKAWKKILRAGSTYDSRPNSLHVFYLAPDDDVGYQGMLFGNIFPEAGFVMSQVGPLHIIGILSRRDWDLKEVNVWEKTLVEPSGGVLEPVVSFHENKTHSRRLVRVMIAHQHEFFRRTKLIESPG